MPDTVTVTAADVRTVTEVFTVAATAFGSALQHIPHFGDALEAVGRMASASQASQMPDDPISTPFQIAVTHHEMLAAYQGAGFERDEAFAIVLTYLSANASATALRGLNGG